MTRMGVEDRRAVVSHRPRLHLAVAAVVAVSLLIFGPTAALLALDCAGVAIKGGCLFTNTGSDTADPDDGYAVTNADGVPMWDFVRDRDAGAIGYPISQRWIDGPFTLQAFQKAILQWNPAEGQMNYYNTLDELANAYPHVELPNVPTHQVLAADAGADFETVKRNHVAILDENPAIKARFLAEPDWLNLYGLPIRYEEREVDSDPQGLQLLRTQRAVFEIWNVPAPGTALGEVGLQNIADKVKRLRNVVVTDPAELPITPRQADESFKPHEVYRRPEDDDYSRDDEDGDARGDDDTPTPQTDNDGFDTEANTDHDGIDTTGGTDNDGFDTEANTDHDGIDTTGGTDNDGFDTEANTDHDGIDTTGGTDNDGFDTEANTDHDGVDTTGNDGIDTPDPETDNDDDTDDDDDSD